MKLFYSSFSCSEAPKRAAFAAIKPLSALLMACLLAAGALAQPKGSASQARGASSNSATRSGQGVTLDFVDAEIAEVAKTFGVIMKRSFVVDPRVKGEMNLTTDRAVSIATAYNQFLSNLRLQGFAVVETAGLYKVVPEAEAKLQAGAVNAGELKLSGNQILTQIFRLNHENANNLVNVLRPLISPNNTINVNPGSNALVITDYADSLQRIAKIIAALDVSNATDVEIIPLKNAVASDLVPLLTRLTEGAASASPQGAAASADGAARSQILAEPRANAVIVRAANSARIQLIRSLIAQLDQPNTTRANGDAGNIHVVYLKNADAVKLATTLRAAIGAEAAASSSARSAGAPTGNTSAPSTGGQIQADPATNALIISAPEPQYRQIRAVIDKLDQRRAQVFVESLIAEVNTDRAAEFGIQWQGGLGNKGDRNVGVIGSNFGNGGNNIINLSLGAASGNVLPGKGLNFGIGHQTNGVYVLGFLARFLESTGDGNVLSTPNLLTLDNEEAKIVIGQNVPFVTGQFTNSGTGGSANSVNPFQTIERKDVGLTLRVKPQISENGHVRLQIFQEVSSVQASSVNSPAGLITNKRSIESNVVVDDGGIIVLGGLLSDEFSGNQEKIPGLGDVPWLGNLFKNEARTRKKSNLMVFLRPIVVRDNQQSESLALDRYEFMRAGQKQLQPQPSSVMGINDAAVLPAQPPQGTTLKITPFISEALIQSPTRTPTVTPTQPESAPRNPAPTTGADRP
jgi:general secretion pathway protein D